MTAFPKTQKSPSQALKTPSIISKKLEPQSLRNLNNGNSQDKSNYLKFLPEFLKTSIIGQSHVIDRVASVLIRGELGLNSTKRPKGSFLFVGPTGTGKTEIAKCFTKYLFPEYPLIRFDMSEFMNQESLGLLIGDRTDSIGFLGRKIEGREKGTILFDEIEKAHPRILDIFLQILDEGRLTLADGKTRNLRGYYIVFTSNIGSSDIRNMRKSSFSTIERAVLNQVNHTLRPELVARINQKIVFNKLNYEAQLEICKNMINGELKRFSEMGFNLEIDNSAFNFILSRGYDERLGARPMRNAIEEHIGNLIAKTILETSSTKEIRGIISVNTNKTELILTPKSQCLAS